MRRLSRVRLRLLEQQMNVDDPPIGRLFVLVPDLWPEEHREACFNRERGEALEDLVERLRTLETKLHPEHEVPGMLIVLEDV